MAEYSPITVARFWSKVDVTPDQDECWLWRASKNAHGYGKFKHNGTVQNASRIAWEIANNSRLGRLVARHRCDNPSCCNPFHLTPGTHQDNVDDKVERGRGRSGDMNGDRNPNAKLTAAQVAEIKIKIESGLSDREISEAYPVSAAMVWRIRKGKSWGMVGREGIEPPANGV